jgi:site-specific DNA-methyltransferase (adenine-specific)
MTDALQFAEFVWLGVAVWDKVNARPQLDRFRQQAEFIVWGSNGTRPADYKNADAVYLPGVFSATNEPQHSRLHMTQKPVPLMDWLCQIARPGQTILDPFMGSGSTGVAASRRGLKFIGIERSEHYFNVARRRLEAENAQGRLCL